MSDDTKKTDDTAKPTPSSNKKPVVFTRELLESYGFKVPDDPPGTGFTIVPIGTGKPRK